MDLAKGRGGVWGRKPRRGGKVFKTDEEWRGNARSGERKGGKRREVCLLKECFSFKRRNGKAPWWGR